MKESTSHSRVVLPLHEQGIAIYSRKSRFTGKGESVGNQIELCRQYLRAHEPDAPEPEIFEDDGFSGGDLNRPAFRRMMRFVIVTYTAATVVYFIYPTQQLLRPEAFAHDNALTRAVAWFYTFDTNTNVCPSLHVIGSAAALFALRDGPQLRKRAWWQATSVLLALCISLSTVFMKQHSILDVLCALPVCALGWWLCYGRPGRHG